MSTNEEGGSVAAQKARARRKANAKKVGASAGNANANSKNSAGKKRATANKPRYGNAEAMIKENFRTLLRGA